MSQRRMQEIILALILFAFLLWFTHGWILVLIPLYIGARWIAPWWQRRKRR